MAMRPLVLSPTQQAEAIGNLVAVRRLGAEMIEVFSRSSAKEAPDARRGAESLVTAVDRVLELLEAPPDLYLDERPGAR